MTGTEASDTMTGNAETRVWAEIVCPVRNGGEPFARTLRSIAQLRCPRPVRLLISDNRSTDGAPWRHRLDEIVNMPVRVISTPESFGRVEHWNWAFQQIQADWIKPLFVGDTVMPEYFERFEEASRRHPRAGLLFCQNKVMHLDKSRVTTANFPDTEIGLEEFVELTLRPLVFVGGLSGVMVRADALRECLPFSERHPWTADARFYRDVARVCPMVGIKEVLCVLDQTIARLSASVRAIGPSLREEWAFMAELQKDAGVPAVGAFRHRAAVLGLLGLAKYGRHVLPETLRRAMGKVYRRFGPGDGAGQGSGETD